LGEREKALCAAGVSRLLQSVLQVGAAEPFHAAVRHPDIALLPVHVVQESRALIVVEVGAQGILPW
jgi:hypothetical protein